MLQHSPAASPPATGNLQPANPHARRRTGKIARLPKVLRDLVNTMIRDGVPYPEIIQNLGDAGTGLRQLNVSRWKQGGFQDWLKEQQRLEAMGSKRQFALDVIRQHPPNQAHQANLELAASQIYELLTDLDLATLKEKLTTGAPDQYTHIVNALSRLSEEGLKYERYRAEVAERKERIRKELEAGSQKGGLRPETRKMIEEELNLL